MTDHASPSFLDELAAIEQSHRDNAELNERDAVQWAETVHASGARERATRHHAAAATLATLREREAELRALFRWLLGEEGEFPESLPGRRYSFRSELRRRLATLDPSLLTPDSPRHAGEE